MQGRLQPHEATLSETAETDYERDITAPQRFAPALVVLWSHDEPSRVGEVVVLPPTARGMSFTLGRAVEAYEDGSLPLTLRRLRPFSSEDRGPFESARVSRWQIRITVEAGDELTIDGIGKGELRVNDHPTRSAAVAPGDTIEAVGRFLLQVTRRPLDWPRAGGWPDVFPFGSADRFGLVGESPAAWLLRQQIMFLAQRDGHVLVEGPSGAGKELVVRAIHAASSRGARPLIARNAVTIPERLSDAELFGNLKDYPSPGTPDRSGLFGDAHRSSLFLDEVGELSETLQASLLRVMDSGEYQRLGDSSMRATDVRVLTATNREPGELKHDFLARFAHRVRVAGFGERSEDVVLVARHLLRGFAARDPAIAERFFAAGEPALSARLVAVLAHHRFTTHTRELTEILWRTIATSSSSLLDLPSDFVVRAAPAAPAAADSTDPRELSREQIVAALARVGGVRDRAWRELGLRSRDQLKRLLKKHDIS
ncbi:sigma 54-interacting transcriptional regulator [Nannocystis sp. SCPEA4]|uniref:sigma-54-dependent transcriptional regulator n=1 Tax=Nannocystis sp. SCPEA4 TaxID=2996787 RepID=UPI00226FB8FE|nr:sigma 54-interacting transcriptional regulator [Nannocystis sp. SCPEA4]MCY1055367.1 sigma 54-interacting transcriptional regulator [Nannocystis sp. SCPEA4]